MYHLPFAARIVGIYSANDFSTLSILEERYLGFPILAEAIQGVLWRVSNNVNAANLINLLAYLAFVLFLRIRVKIPFMISSVFYFSIPLIFIGFFSSYIDLFTNTFLAMAFIGLYFFWREKKMTDGLWVIIFLAIANNSKYTSLVFSAIGYLLFLKIFFEPKISLQNIKKILFVVISSVIIFFPQFKNVVVYGNFIYPQKVPILNNIFHNGNQETNAKDQAPLYLRDSSSFIKFVYSFFEINTIDDRRPHRWTIDQGDVSGDSKSFRMGGYFYFNIIFWMVLIIFIMFALKGDGRQFAVKTYVWLMGLILIVSLMPQSHELRYWSFIPILLFSFILTFGKDLVDRNKLNFIYPMYIVFFVQMMIFIFVFTNIGVLSVGAKNTVFSDYNLKSVASGYSGVCLYEMSNWRPFFYRLATKKDVNMQYVGFRESCNNKYVPYSGSK
ncbi:MAG: hypothetical protein WC823_01770 [Parcubacteria group bacterium]|jgi:hypothetical protein